MRALITVMVVALVGSSAGVADADAKQALKLNVQGMKKYQQKKYSEAADLFKKAIAADETLAYAHYNLASMASLMEDFPLVIQELEWCKKSTDPVAAKLLAKAKNDKDLERALMHPRVRELVGAPALDTMTLDAVLLERTGIWGDGPDACGDDNVTVTFKKGGKLSLVAFWACNDGNTRKTDVGTWVVKDGVLTMTTKKAKVFEAKEVTGKLGPCDDGDQSSGQCLILDAGNKLRRGSQEYF